MQFLQLISQGKRIDLEACHGAYVRRRSSPGPVCCNNSCSELLARSELLGKEDQALLEGIAVSIAETLGTVQTVAQGKGLTEVSRPRKGLGCRTERPVGEAVIVVLREEETWNAYLWAAWATEKTFQSDIL